MAEHIGIIVRKREKNRKGHVGFLCFLLFHAYRTVLLA